MGLRELKNRLSEYVRDVRAGHSLLVTDRGEVVAELVPPGHVKDAGGATAGLLALARQGHVTLGGDNGESLYPKLSRVLEGYRSAELLDAERGGR